MRLRSPAWPRNARFATIFEPSIQAYQKSWGARWSSYHLGTQRTPPSRSRGTSRKVAYSWCPAGGTAAKDFVSLYLLEAFITVTATAWHAYLCLAVSLKYSFGPRPAVNCWHYLADWHGQQRWQALILPCYLQASSIELLLLYFLRRSFIFSQAKQLLIFISES